ncbi:MAG TPA: hypothetical protein VID04_06825 [Methylomirabilota bacterium]|jgi:hypothetical protein
MASSLFRHAGVACLALALVSGVNGPTVAGEAREALVRAAHEKLERHEKCEASFKAAQQRRFEASRKPYLSDLDRQKDWARLDLAMETQRQCVAPAAAELQSALAALEIQSQKDFDEAQTKLARAAAADRPGLETARSQAATAMKWARFQRLQREQLEKLRIREADCEQGAENTTELIKSNTTTKDHEVYERERKNFLSCAENARQQQAEILAALGGRVSVGTVEGQAAFERDVQALLRTLEQLAAQLDDRQSVRYDDFAARMTRLSRDLDTFKTRYAQVLADPKGQPLASRLLQAGDVVVASATTWKRAAGIQDGAQRDAILRDVSAQWQRFGILVRESAALAGRTGREESGQASPATR